MLRHPRFFLLFVIITGFALNTAAQTSKKPNRTKIIALPLLFYSPDTKLGGGAGGLLTFNFPKDSLYARRSSVTFGAAYTRLNQVLLYFPYQLFLKNQQYWLYGEVGYYRYVYNYFGVGNDYPDDYIEKYDATFPRLRINALKKIYPGIYAGLRYQIDDLHITPRSATGDLAAPALLGNTGGRVAGLGPLLNLDTRDQLFFPTRGYLLETAIYTESKLTGSDFRNDRLSVDASKYLALGKNSVLALNSYLVLSRGKIPYHQLPFLGGSKRLRGFYERKYADNNLFLIQGELRFPVFWRFGGVVFAGTGAVADHPNNFNINTLHSSYGLGLRILLDRQQHINLRLDYGRSRKSGGFYLTIGEAF